MCSVGEHADKAELDINILEKNILRASVLSEAMFIVEGGEFFLYTHYEKLLSCLQARDYAIFTNATLPEKIISACQKYSIPKLIISLDAAPEQNKLIRGSNIEDIVRIIDRVHKAREVMLSYTISSHNSPEDLAWVAEFAREQKVRLLLNVYNKLSYLFSPDEEKTIYPFESFAQDSFLSAYNSWLLGKISVPCFSIRYISTVYPDGKIALCKKKTGISLGNIYENDFDSIWNAGLTKELQNKNIACNQCWLKCQKGFDFYFHIKYGRFLPRFLKKRLFS